MAKTLHKNLVFWDNVDNWKSLKGYDSIPMELPAD
jgi:hypothetical protein